MKTTWFREIQNMSSEDYSILYSISTLLLALFVGGILVGIIAVIYMYISDITQTTHAIRRNYPVFGRFRYLFESLGEFFRQYFFAMDREEMPFNRAERSWVYRTAKNIDSTIGFGSTRNLNLTGTVLFVNCPFPTLEADSTTPEVLIIGPYCKHPYLTGSIFNISGMSFGAISKPAVLALSKGAAAAGCWMNTGEGGVSPYHLEGGADLVVQIGTAKYGVRDAQGKMDLGKLAAIAQHEQVKMFELKLSQGAKPGKGGLLPGLKVTEEIAQIRGIPAGEDSNSPNRHLEIDNIGDLLDTIELIRTTTGKPTGFKIVLGAYGFLDGLCKEIHRRGVESAPDVITLDGGDGGSGAAPQSLIDYMGLSLKESLPLLSNKLIEYDLKRRIRIVASGKLITPSAVAWALCLGADFVTTARGFMFALGCIQALQCNKNTCPTGITTHDKRLQKGLVVTDKAERVKNYANNMTWEVGVIAHSCGVPEPRRLRRFHARVVGNAGLSIPLDELHPEPANASNEKRNLIATESRT